MRRRKILGALGSAGAALLAGCSGDSADGGGGPDSSPDGSGEDSDGTESTDTGTPTEEPFRIGEPIWGQRGGNAAGSESVDAVGVTSDEPARYSTSLPLGRNADYYQFYDPVFTENAVIHRGQIIDKATGEQVASFPGRETAAPAVRDGRIFVLIGSDLIALDGETYERVWDYTTAKNGVAIAATEERVFVALGDSITAVSASDGEQQWNVSTPALSNPGIGDFGATQGRVYANGRGSGVSVRNGSDGSELWALSEGEIHVSRTGNVYARIDGPDLARYDPDGNEVWRVEEILGPPLASDSASVYLVDQIQGEVAAHSVEDGSQLWTKKPPLSPVDVAAGSDGLYVLGTGESSARLFVLNKQSGERERLYSLNSDTRTTIAVGGGAVAFARSSINNNRMQFLVDAETTASN